MTEFERELLAAQNKTNRLLSELVYFQQQVWINTTTERGPDGLLRPNDNAFADLLRAVQALALEAARKP